MIFKQLKDLVIDRFKKLSRSATQLFVTDVTNVEIWETYLNSYPEKVRQEYNCNCCKSFFRQYGNIVFIDTNYQVQSLWDVEVSAEYLKTVNDLNALVVNRAIKGIFTTTESKLGTPFSHTKKENLVLTYHHFHLDFPRKFQNTTGSSNEAVVGSYTSLKNVFKRGLEELTVDSMETVLELIAQGSLYRGAEHQSTVEKFLALKKKYSRLSDSQKDNYCWLESKGNWAARVRNSSIGTLLVNLSEKMDLETAVKKYEFVVAPQNYKRPTALITKAMITAAAKKIGEMGYSESLGRRFAITSDITAANVVYLDRMVKKALNMDVFDVMLKEVGKSAPKKLDKIEEISIKDFISNVIPTAKSLELMLENKHESNLVSLISPKDKEAPSMFKWDNNFSWSYAGNVTDSMMKEAVKSHGGKVDGILRFSMQWNDNRNDGNIDLDAHCHAPGFHHSYSSKHDHRTGGTLDVDIQTPRDYPVAVENITWPTLSKMKDGKYKFSVHNYSSRRCEDGFHAEIEFNGEIHSFNYPKSMSGHVTIQVATVTLNNGVFTIENHLAGSSAKPTRKVWGIDTQKFHKVKLVTLSPNHWDENNVGNKHYFFILEDCINEERARGFYNEFLKNDLITSKKFFEALGNKMKVEESSEQLSGLGFSETKRNSVVVKVEGKFSRMLKINF
jgi:hypothetical protein